MNTDILFKLFLSLLLGSFIGIERQLHSRHEKKRENNSFLGLRTFALFTTMGTISGFLEKDLPFLFLLVTLAVVIMITCYYVFDSMATKDFGITTEMTLLLSYIIGVLLAADIFSVPLIIGLTVVLVFLLSQKERLNTYVNAIKRKEMQAFIRYAIIALVILPLLPNESIKIANIPYAVDILNYFNLSYTKLKNIEVVNPYQLWFFVVLVTGIDVIGYTAGKIIGKKKGWFLASFAGGFISSTATTQALAHQSKKSNAVNVLVLSVLIANIASFFQHALLIFPINSELFARIIPSILFMILAGSIISFILMKKKEDKNDITSGEIMKKEIFHLLPAIKFAILFVLVKIISASALILFGNSGFLLTIAVGALPGLDAVLITLAQEAGNSITFQYALIAFLIANTANLGVKCGLVFINGKRSFAIKFLFSVLVIVVAGFMGLLFRF